MSNKATVLKELDQVYQQWQKLLSSLSDDQRSKPLLPSHWTVKDVLAHLYVWQQGSVANLEAALANRQPDYELLRRFGAGMEDDVDATNAWIYETNKDKPWLEVHTLWMTQFLHYLELLKDFPEEWLLEPGRYPWMGDYSLLASPEGSLDHHQEHLESLQTWLREHAPASE